MSENRKKSIKIRVSEDEFLKLNSLKTKSRLAEWMRELCLGQSQKVKVNSVNVDPDLLRQVAAIGNNINQIARVANAKGELSHLVELTHIQHQLKALLNAHQTP